MRFFTSLLAIGSLLGLAQGDATVCSTSGCKTLADDLGHRSMNTSADPCTDFDNYVCGNWAKYHPLPDSLGRISYFSILNSKVMDAVQTGMKQATTKSKAQVVNYLVDMYNECNNTTARETQGTQPLVDLVDNLIGGWPILGKSPKKMEWQDMFTNVVSKAGVSPALQFVVQHERHLNKKVLFLAPGTSGLPPAVLMNTMAYAKYYNAYKQYIKDVVVMMGAPHDAHLDKNIDKIISVEKELAEVLQLSPFNMVRMTSFERLAMLVGDETDMLKIVNNILKGFGSTQSAFSSHDQLAVVNAEYIVGAIKVFQKTPIDALQNYFGWMLAMSYGPATTHKFRHAEAGYRSTMTGITQEAPDQTYCYQVVNAKLSFAVARVYVDATFTQADRNEAITMVKELKKSFHSILEQNTWLDAPTRAYALKKLEHIKENIGYPDWLMVDAELDDFNHHFTGAKVTKGKFLESMANLFARDARKGFDEYATALNHTRVWPMTPATVNAAYMPIENSITIPAAILSPPFFDRDRPVSMNYGGIGAVIGHEMTHGFDNMGRRFNAEGKEDDWWTQQTLQEFERHARCFVTQYSRIHDPFANLYIDGQLTLGENIADNGGVKESWFAYQAHQKTKASEVLPELKRTADQLFFISFARNWCSVINKQTLQMQIKTNPHTPDKYRTLVVLANSPQFSEAFNCPATSAMNPANKCAVW